MLLALLVVLKLGITAYNATAYSQQSYDWKMHVGRARSGGLSLSGRAYNPPLYYLPVLPYLKLQEFRGEPAPSPNALLAFMRWTNLGYLAVLYVCWVFCIFPAVAGDYRAATVASLVLLAIPGYQKMAAASHPDNALASLSALCMALWLWLRRRHPPPTLDDRRAGRRRTSVFVALTLAAGLAGLTRPFGVVPAAVFLGAVFVELARGRRIFSKSFIVAACVTGATIVALAGSWYGYQRFVVGRMARVYQQSYIQRFVPRRKNFDFVRYFTTFRFASLLETPNRNMREPAPVRPIGGKGVQAKKRARNPGSNSFFTLLYSETWGDHWLYFSGSQKTDYKVWPKRLLFVVALPLVPLLTVRFVRGLWRSVRDWRPRLGHGLEPLFALGFFALGVALYLYWQTGQGLLPGKNSTVKFLYVSFLVPFALLLCAVPRLGKRSFNIWLFYLLTLFMTAFPVAVFWGAVR